MGAFIDITGQQFGNWIAIKYDKTIKKWECECQCSNKTHKFIASADLRKGKSTNCGCMRKNDLTGKQFGHLIVDSYAGEYHWNCHCKECNKQFKVHTYHLEHGNIPNCTHSELHTNVYDITGKQFNEWTVLEYAGKKYWRCRCSCGIERNILGKELRNRSSKSCGHDTPWVHGLLNSDNKFNDLTGKQFGFWKVLEYSGNGLWKCQCQCENKTIKIVKGTALKSGHSKSCGHNSGVLKDLTDKQFGSLKVIEYINNGLWKCQCKCGKITYKKGKELKNGHVKTCGDICHRYEDIKGQKFNSFVAIEYISKGFWKCECECGNIRIHSVTELKNGTAKSCGCKQYLYRDESMIKSGIFKERTDEQKKAVRSREEMIKFIGDRKLTMMQLADELNVTNHYISRLCSRYNIDSNYVVKNKPTSSLEDELYGYIRSIYNNNVERHNRTILKGKELDIYIPEKKLAIEFNGTYWHCDKILDKYYHQHKTIECAKQGIRLIHIFEYEWNNKIKRDKIKDIIYNILNYDKLNKYCARGLVVKNINASDAESFENKFHLQSSVSALINYGIYNNNEILGIMSFDKPRFNQEFDFEIIRLCYKSNVYIVDGTEKLFKQFLQDYKPLSVVTYCDISKFVGNTYTKLGFKTSVNNISEPNYVWVSPDRNDILTRYQTQKQRLIKYGYSDLGKTEDEIMRNLGYFKVYDSGNIKLTWIKEDNYICIY